MRMFAVDGPYCAAIWPDFSAKPDGGRHPRESSAGVTAVQGSFGAQGGGGGGSSPPPVGAELLGAPKAEENFWSKLMGAEEKIFDRPKARRKIWLNI